MTKLSFSEARLLLWLAISCLLSYMTVATTLPVISVHVTTDLGFNSALGGLAVGIVFLSTILTRGIAGQMVDRIGAKQSLRRGIVLYSIANAICALSTLITAPWASYSVLVLGRLIMGLGESLTIVSFVNWAIGLLGVRRSGKVMAWMGAGMYGAFAVGAPLGNFLYDQSGFMATAIASTLLPLIGWALVFRIPAVAPAPREQARLPLISIVRRIFSPGSVVCLQGVGFAVLGAFSTLYFEQHSWAHASMAMICFGVGYVMVRILFGDMPDRVGGIPVAFVSLITETIGQALLWLAPMPEVALLGALLTGFGCSMIFPSMGVFVIHHLPANERGAALGSFSAFQDLSYGASAPLTGLLADRFGYHCVFLVGMIASLGGLLTLLSMHRKEKRKDAPSPQLP